MVWHWVYNNVRCRVQWARQLSKPLDFGYSTLYSILKKKKNSKTDTLNWSEVCLEYCLKASTLEVDNYAPNIIDKYIPIDVVFHHYITPQKQSQNYVRILSPLIVGIHKQFQFAI